ncbi:MAG: IPExxxVDY family protein [Bacteroidales bacterium]
MPRRAKLGTDFEHLDAFIGISYHLRDYRLVYEINKTLSLALEKVDDLPVYNPRTLGMSEYSCYTSTDSDTLLTYFLLSNAGSDGLMFGQYRQSDFFLLVKGAGGNETEDKLVELIKTLPNVLTAFSIDQVKIVNVDILISDLELHEIQLKKNSKGFIRNEDISDDL